MYILKLLYKMKINFDFTFKNYKIIKNYNNLSCNFLIIANKTFEKQDNLRKKIKNSFLYSHQIANKAFIQVIKISIVKNFEEIVKGPVFFIALCKNKIPLEKIMRFSKKSLILLNAIAFKLNNKIYFYKKLYISNFLTYKENIILLLQLNIIEIKNILKN